MEIYKDVSSPASQEFEKLLNSQLSKVQIWTPNLIFGTLDPGNIGSQDILRTLDPGNTGSQSI